MNADRLRIQTWLVWGVTASLPFLIGRNPFTMLIALCGVIAVNRSWHVVAVSPHGWSLVARAAVVLAVVSVLFNVLTVRTGDRVIFTVSDGVRGFSGPITINAVVFGLLAAFGVLGLIAVWATVGSQVSWAQFTRILPYPVLGFAVAGSTAINLVPQTAAAITDIREASAARGFAPHKAREAAVLLTPVINAGLDRSMRLAEVLEARGFGGRRIAVRQNQTRSFVAWNALLAGLLVGSYGVIAGIGWAAVGGLLAVLIGGTLLARTRDSGAIRRTRYRKDLLGRNDWIVIGVSVAMVVGMLIVRSLDGDAYRYEPYPILHAPEVGLGALIPLIGLFVPAFLAPRRSPNRD